MRAWFDYPRWVVAEAGPAGALITHEPDTAIECASHGRGLPAGRAAWEAAERTKEAVDAALNSKVHLPRLREMGVARLDERSGIPARTLRDILAARAYPRTRHCIKLIAAASDGVS